MQKELIYDMMNGFCDHANMPKNLSIPDEFSEGTECGRLCEQAYNASLKLNEKLGREEDEDLENLINCMNRIMKILSMKMYDYGKVEGYKQYDGIKEQY